MLSDRDTAKSYFTGEGADQKNRGGLGKTADLGIHDVFGIRDERLDLLVTLRSIPQARFIIHPVYSVNHSESGFEKVFQCCAAYVVWTLVLEPGQRAEYSLDCSLEKI